MKKLFVNITSWVGLSPGAIHYYAKIVEFESDKNIYALANGTYYAFGDDKSPEEFYRILTDHEEVKKLNEREGRDSYYKVGDQTWRFNNVDEIKKLVEEVYPDHDIVYFHNKELLSEDMDVVERSPKETKKTGKKIEIHNFKGFSKEFVNLTEGSVHECVECPERHAHKNLLGEWVWGITEPVRVLPGEFIYV